MWNEVFIAILKMRILIIDKNKLVLEGFCNVINSNFDIDLVVCESDSEGDEYLVTASRIGIKIDVIFLDVKNNEILNSTPLLLANQYKKTINPKLSIVLFTMENKSKLMQDSIDIGYADFYIPKSISTEDLKLLISNIRFLKYSFG